MKRTEIQFLGIALLVLFIITACAIRTLDPTRDIAEIPYKDLSQVKKVSNEFYEASIKYVAFTGLYSGFRAFRLTIKNQTSSDLEIDWNKTLFINNGVTDGGFSYQGIMLADKNIQRTPDVIFPGSTLFKIIWPSNYTYHYKSWGRKGIGGILLSVKADGKEIKEKILVSFVP